MKGNKKEFELSQAQTPLSDFLESYNQSIPVSFPSASVAMLKKFKSAYPALFKNGDLWSMALHRKKLIDWIFGQRDFS